MPRIPEDFDDFVRAELPRLLRLARVLTRNEHDAWDITQEALARVGARWKQVDADGNPAAYARKALVRLNLNRTRQLRREVLVRVAPDRPAVNGSTDSTDELQRALSRLAPRQRTALVLRYYSDLSIADVAMLMDCSEGTVKSQVSRGLALLREQLPTDSRN